MEKQANTVEREQEKRLGKRGTGIIAAGLLIALVALVLARAFGWTVLTGFVLGSLVVEASLAGLLMGVALLIVWVLTHAGKVRKPLHHFALTGVSAEEVTFPSSQGDHLINGLYFPQQEFAPTILVSSGFRRDITDVLKTSTLLWQAGYQVLAFEYHGHGSRSAGVSVTLGHRELNDFMGAVAYAHRRDPDASLGAMGYSMGAAVTIVGAARCPSIEAVVADSSFASVWSAVELAVHRTFHLSRRLPAWLLGTLYAITDSLLWWRAGFHFREFEPAREIAKIAPRPVLLIHGAADSIVSSNDATTLYSQAGEGKELWLIPGAQHTTGHLVERTAYGARILGFFDMALRQIPVSRQTDPLPAEIKREQLVAQNSLREN